MHTVGQMRTRVPIAQFSEIFEQWLQQLVHVRCSKRHPYVYRSQCPQIPADRISEQWQHRHWSALEFIRLEILQQNFFLRLYLEQFEQQAQELSWTLIAIDSPDTTQFERLVNESFRCVEKIQISNVRKACQSTKQTCQCKAVFFPERRFIDTIADYGLDQKLNE